MDEQYTCTCLMSRVETRLFYDLVPMLPIIDPTPSLNLGIASDVEGECNERELDYLENDTLTDRS